MARMTQQLYRRFRTAEIFNHSAVQEAKCEKAGGHPEADMEQVHLLEALDWLMRAQDILPHGGLSRGYSFGWNPFCPKKGWQPAHPKPTAEAIITLFDCAEAMSRIDLRQRAIDLADWLVKIQMYSGAIRGGALNEVRSSEVLNTALAILGWIRMARETGAERSVLAIRKAADFLIGLQQEAAKPGRHVPDAAGYGDALGVSSVGLALIQTGIFLEEYNCCAVGERCLNQAISLQETNGWFRNNGHDPTHQTLLQNLASTVENILMCGIILDNPKYVHSARLTADVLLERLQAGKVLCGRFFPDWSDGVSWSGQFGNGKMASIWIRLYQITDTNAYLTAAHRTIASLKRGQNRISTDPGLRGGIKGCFPCDGDFGRYQTLSSATIQCINALLLVERMAQQQAAAPRNTIPARA